MIVYVIKNDKVIVVCFIPCSLKLNKYSYLLPTLKFQCFDMARRGSDLCKLHFFFCHFFSVRPKFIERNPCPNKSYWFGLIVQIRSTFLIITCHEYVHLNVALRLLTAILYVRTNAKFIFRCCVHYIHVVKVVLYMHKPSLVRFTSFFLKAI